MEIGRGRKDSILRQARKGFFVYRGKPIDLNLETHGESLHLKLASPK